MSVEMCFFKDVTLLVTHYNRSNSLNHLLNTFRDCKCVFGGIVVSDDGSHSFHLDSLKNLQNEFGFELITTPTNKGLGNNINKGQDAVRTPFTLYVQEDFEPAKDFCIHFEKAVEIFREHSDIDIIRFYSYSRYPYLKPYKEGFSQMMYPHFATKYSKIYYYSDHPHLRRSTFLKKFGNYLEGLKGDRTEYRMCLSFIQNKGKGLFYNDFQNLFFQKNSKSEPSTMTRSKWTQSSNFLIRLARNFYRQAKYNYDILFFKGKHS